MIPKTKQLAKPSWDTAVTSYQVWFLFDVPSNPAFAPCRTEDGHIISFPTRQEASSFMRRRSSSFPSGKYLLVECSDSRACSILSSVRVTLPHGGESEKD